MIRGIILALCIGSIICTRAAAELTAFWRNNPITPQAIANDSTLGTMQSWSVMVTNTSGWFASAGLRAVLPTGLNFYRNSLGGNTRPSEAAIGSHPALGFHTYVTAPHQRSGGSDPPAILGPFPKSAQFSFGGPFDPVPGTFSVTWGNPFGYLHPVGTFEIARLTFPATVVPTIDSASVVFYAGPTNETIIPTTVPEPSVMILIVATLASVIARKRLTRHFVIAMCIGSAMCSSAYAELTAFWRNNPITPQAIANDSTLGTMQSWSVMVTNTEGLFSAAGLRATLVAGRTFYRNPNGGPFRPSAAQQAANPALEFHTYVTMPRMFGGLAAILGGFPDTLAPASFGGPLDPIPGTFSVAWGDADPNSFPPGTYEIVRLTFPNDVLPTIHPESVCYYTPNQSVLLPVVIPEPATTGALLAALCLLLRRLPGL